MPAKDKTVKVTRRRAARRNRIATLARAQMVAEVAPVEVAPAVAAPVATAADVPTITVAQLAAELSLSPSTIKTHARNMKAHKAGKTFLLTNAQADQIRANPPRARAGARTPAPEAA